MAYDDSNNQDIEQQAVSSTPLSGGSTGAQPTQPSPEAQNAPSQPSTIQAGMSSAEAGSSQAQSQQRSNKPASSGMFTNIQKYVEKNKPAAQKMATAATQNVAGQASDIAEQAAKKKAQMDATLAANKTSMEEQKKWATGQVEGIMGTGDQRDLSQITADTNAYEKSVLGDKYGDYQKEMEESRRRMYAQPVTMPGQETPMGKYQNDIKAKYFTDDMQTQDQYNQARFQAMMGGAQGLTDVGALNLGKENQKARALQQLAGGIGTEQGRRNLLKDTFQGNGEYTRGMGGLDNLIVSGDQGARESMIKGVQGTATGLQEGLKGQSSAANTARLAQQQGIRDFSGEVTGLAEAGYGTLDKGMDERLAAEMDLRKGLTSQFDQSASDIEDWKTAQLAGLGDVDNWQNIAKMLSEQDVNWGARGRDYFKKIAEGDGSLLDGSFAIDEKAMQEALRNVIGNTKFGDSEDNLTKTYGADDVWKGAWAGSKSHNKHSDLQKFDPKAIMDQFKKLKESISETDAQKLLKDKFLAENQGQSYDDYIAGTTLDKYDTADQAFIDKLKKLQDLTGKSIFTDELRDTGYSKTDAMKQLLQKYRDDNLPEGTEVRTSDQPSGGVRK
jgi:hypothetical protein